MAPQDTSAYQDNPYGNQDPYALYGQLTDENSKNLSPSGVIRQGALNTGFNPQVQHAQMVQKNIAKIMQDNPEQEGEDPIDTQMRQARAIQSGMMDIDPATAMRANQQIIRLQQAKTQQAGLQAETSERAAHARELNIQANQARTVMVQEESELINGIKLRSSKSVGDSLDPNSATYNADLAAASRAHPGAIPMSIDEYNKRIAAEGQNRAIAQYYGTQQRVAASASNNGLQPYEALTPTQKDTAAYTWAIGDKQPGDLDRKGERRFNEYIDSGDLQQGDQTTARAELAELKTGSKAAANRNGNIEGLTVSLTGFGNKVKTALANAEAAGAAEGDYRLVNAALQFGQRNILVGDDSQKAAALRALLVAENEFVYEHGRLLSGGGARTNVAAVRDAKNNLSASDNPTVARAAVDQIIKQALPVLHGANKYALEALANKDNYPALSRMAKVFGGANLYGGKDDQSRDANVPPAPGVNPNAPPAPAPGVTAPPTSTPTDQYDHLFLRNPRGG